MHKGDKNVIKTWSRASIIVSQVLQGRAVQAQQPSDNTADNWGCTEEVAPSSAYPLPPLPFLQEEVGEAHIFVCCHGARDARCGALGPPLASRLLVLVRQRGLQDRVKVYKTSHVGGHKVGVLGFPAYCHTCCHISLPSR